MEKSPSGGCQLGNRDSDSKAWADCAGAHGQEPMKSFELRSMMQEHLRRHETSSVEEERTAGQHQRIHFLNHFEDFLHRHLTKGIQS
jgi:hypothetical protein